MNLSEEELKWDFSKVDTSFNRSSQWNHSVKHVNNIFRKNDNDKPKISVLFKQFPNALEAICRCSEFGHEKYKDVDADWMNFLNIESDRYKDAMLRHLMNGDSMDDESGLPHIFHVAWNAMAMLETYIKNVKNKDEYTRQNTRNTP